MLAALIWAVAALVIWLVAPPQQRLLGFTIIMSSVAMTVVIAGLAIGLFRDAGGGALAREQSARLMHLATQLQNGDMNVARLAARLEQVVGDGQAANAVDAISRRLNSLEDGLRRLSEKELDASVAAFSDQLRAEVDGLRARLALTEDQVLSQAANVERLTRVRD